MIKCCFGLPGLYSVCRFGASILDKYLLAGSIAWVMNKLNLKNALHNIKKYYLKYLIKLAKNDSTRGFFNDIIFYLVDKSDASPSELQQLIESNLETDKRGKSMTTLEQLRHEGIQIGMQEGIQQGMQQGRQQGMQQGMQEGIQQGMQEGIQQGRQQGIEEGKHEQSVIIAKRLLKSGLPVDQVLTMIDLPASELGKLSR